MSFTVLIHSSKTMRSIASSHATKPLLLERAAPLATYLKTLSPGQLQTAMHISAPLSEKVHLMLAEWNIEPCQQSFAIDSFVGDIYSGLRAPTLNQSDRDYAQETLRILSGLYGILRPYDGVRPYRLEMGYKFPEKSFKNLYDYWGKSIVDTLPPDGIVVNLSAVEYTKTVVPYLDAERIITPKFLTVHPVTGTPGQVIVHTKIARGAFARWLIQSRVQAVHEMTQFNDLNYAYDPTLSTHSEPVFVCKDFGGIGLSMRLQA